MDCAVDVRSNCSISHHLGRELTCFSLHQFESVCLVHLKKIGIESDLALGRCGLGFRTTGNTDPGCKQQSCDDQNAIRNGGLHGITSCPTLKFSWLTALK